MELMGFQFSEMQILAWSSKSWVSDRFFSNEFSPPTFSDHRVRIAVQELLSQWLVAYINSALQLADEVDCLLVPAELLNPDHHRVHVLRQRALT